MNITQRILLFAVPWEIIIFMSMVIIVYFAEKMRIKKGKNRKQKN